MILSDTLAATGQPFNDFESVSFLLKGLGTKPGWTIYPLMSCMDIFWLIRCALSNNFQHLISPSPLPTTLLGLACREEEDTVAEALHLVATPIFMGEVHLLATVDMDPTSQ